MGKILVTKSEWEVIDKSRVSHFDDKNWNIKDSGCAGVVLKELGCKFFDTKYIPGLFYGFEVIECKDVRADGERESVKEEQKR